MSRTVEEREVDIFGRDVKETWRGPWCSYYGYWARYVWDGKKLNIERISMEYWWDKGLKYIDLPE